MLRGQDVILLLSLVDEDQRVPIRELASDVGYNPAGTQRALERLDDAGLYDRRRRRAPIAAVEEFCVHAVKYFFAARLGAETRGTLAAWAAEPIVSLMAPTDELPPVWPHPEGGARGLSMEPLHPIAITAAARDPRLKRRLAMLDTLRAGDVRLRGLAADLLVAELRSDRS